MTVLTEAMYLDAAFIESEAQGRRSRDEVTLGVDAVELAAGTVLKESGGEFVRFDGTGTASAILMLAANTADAAMQAAVIVRDAEVTAERLVFNDDATQAHMDAAYASLESQGVIVRNTGA